MKTKITRRGLMATAAGAAVASAQTIPSPSDVNRADLAKAIREQNQRASDGLAKFEISMTTEPAFQFKA